MPATFHLVARPGQPTFLDLPWDTPLDEWRSERLVEVVRGISRHVVRFVDYDGQLFALKELPRRYAEREYRLLRTLAAESMPVVDVVGVVSERAPELDSVLITRHLEFSIPYRTLFAERCKPDVRSTLVSALSELLVRLHLTGFFWGDCSLSNALFRDDAGALSAYLVDAETGELHSALSDGQREHDLMIAEENVVGELMDVHGEIGERPWDVDPVELASELRARYETLWSELTREEVFGPDERYRVDERLGRLNELGFDVEEIELEPAGGGYRLRLDPHLVEPGHHRRRLLRLTGLSAQENQARRMLNDLAAFRARLEQAEGRPVPESVAAYRWRAEVFEPAIDAVPAELLERKGAAEVFHEILEHRWYMSERGGTDAGLLAAVRSYVGETSAST
jgi:tRNA A-37 threonylcarbamoyl transferase component Bud32